MDEFDFESSNTFDIGDLFGGDVGSSGVDLSALGNDFSGFDNLDISSLLSGGDNFTPGDFGGSLGSELAAALQDTGNSSSLFSGDGGIDLSALTEGVGDFDQAAPPSNIAELLRGVTGGNDSSELLTPGGVNESFLDNLSPEERARYQAMQEDDYKTPTYGVQDLGISQEMMDEFNTNFQPKDGFSSQWQDVGGNKVMINDDPQGGSTATVFNPTTGQTSYLTEEQTQALIANGTLNTKGSGYVAATGGTGNVQGGGRTFFNDDGTKTVIKTDGSVLKIDKDGKVIDTGKKVDVNDEKAIVATCPSPEMLILLSNGEQRKAGDLQVGDEVKTQHETTMEWGNFKVTHAEIILNAKRLNIKLDGKDFICSVDHKFYKDGAWVDAKDIKVGDVLSDKSVTEIAEHSTGDVVQITVDDAHTYICEGVLSHNKSPVGPTVVPPKQPVTPGTPVKPDGKKDNNMLMMLLALMAMMNKGGGSSTGSGGTIPSLQANRSQLPYGPISGSQARPGAGGVNYFSPTSYTQKAAGGGMMYGGGGISDLGGYSDGGRLLRGPGDGVSDSIPATIGGKQPARLAEGEFVVPARVVSELGNGSTEAGAKKLYAMMDRVQKARRKTKNVAADTKAHKYLPA